MDSDPDLDHRFGRPARRLASLQLEALDVGLVEGEPTFAVSGDTFPLDGTLKRAGGQWQSDRQAWLFQGDEALGRLVANLEADGVLTPLAELNEATATVFEGFVKTPPLRRRFLDQGPIGFSETDLLQLLLTFTDRTLETDELSRALIERFGSLGAVFAAEPERLEEHADLVPAGRALLKAVQVAIERVLHEPIKENPVIGSWSALIDYLKVTLRHKTTEHLLVLYLDRKNRLIRDELQAVGTVDHTPLYPREIVKRALELSASALILVHNHPSGDPTPSKADIDMTKQVVRALETVAINVHDHVIVGRNDYLSFRAQRLL